MTKHDHNRMIKAITCDRSNKEKLIEAIGGLQSTDDPSLVPLYNELLEELNTLEEKEVQNGSQ